MDPHLRPEDVDGLRRSLAMSPHLPADEVARLLDDHRLLLLERQELVALLTELEPHFRDVRRVLNRLHHLLLAPDAGVDRCDDGAPGR